MGKQYRFNLSRPILGNIKTVTIKADALGDFYMSVVTDHIATESIPKTGKAAGYDFGLKTMFTCSDGTQHESPHFYQTAHSDLQRTQRKLSSKQKGSNNSERERLKTVRVHRKIRRQRENHHWKLAKQLVHEYDALCFETLTFFTALFLSFHSPRVIGFFRSSSLPAHLLQTGVPMPFLCPNIVD